MNGRAYTFREDCLIRNFAGIKTAEEMGLMLGRTRSSIHHRVKKLGLNGVIHGEHHWASKVDSLKMAMIHTLLDSGFSSSEVHRMFAEPLNLSKDYVSQIARGRYRHRG